MSKLGPLFLSEQYLRDSEWLAAHLSELTAQYPDSWVAVLNEQVVAAGSPEEVFERAEEVQRKGGMAVVCLIEATPRAYAGTTSKD